MISLGMYNLFCSCSPLSRMIHYRKKNKGETETFGTSAIYKSLRLCLPNWIIMKHKQSPVMTLGRCSNHLDFNCWENLHQKFLKFTHKMIILSTGQSRLLNNKSREDELYCKVKSAHFSQI